jgi:sulfide:quinone oxidoreductase
MAPKKLTDDLSVSPQILPGDVAGLAAMGFKSIIGNRPDGEGADQPSFSEIEREAQANGLAVRYIPIETGKITDADAAAFGVAIAEMPKPILAYCRSGTRSSMVWALSQEGRAATTDLLSKAGAAGKR